MNINNRPITSIHQVVSGKGLTQERPVQSNNEFASILSQKLSEGRDIKISKHAAARLEARNINLTNEQVQRLKNAVDKAYSKGIKDTLIVMDEVAFVVNVNARTVITAVNQGELKENVFTNIDGAVFT
ncbi:MAG: flagellar biosynthesis protein [Clostridiaceae bacterium]|nr:flagellar biosynthesis protein [Clostridiaceae bacterium]